MSHILGAQSRRDFIKQTALPTSALAAAGPSFMSAGDVPAANIAKLPWYRSTLRRGQTNITEIDPTRYDIARWRQHWKCTRTQCVIMNAGVIVAYYESQVPLHLPAHLECNHSSLRISNTG